MAQSNRDNNQKFSPAEKLTITGLTFLAVLILGIFLMLITGKMVIPF